MVIEPMGSAEEGKVIGRSGEVDELLAGVLAVLPAALALFRAIDRDFRLVQWNDEFERLVGDERRLAMGESLREVFQLAERQSVTDLFSRVRASREPGGLFAPDINWSGPSHATILWNLNAYPVIGDGGGVTHILAVAQRTLEGLAADERQARETTKLRERAEQLEDLERAKSEFLSLASHELRGPAATLRGYLSMLEDGSLGKLPESVQAVLPLLKAKAMQINMLANEMVEAGRLEDKSLQLKLRPLALGTLIMRSIDDVRLQVPERHRIRFHDRANQPITVLADSMRIEVIVSNLLDNAVKYSPMGGDIDVQLSVAGELALVSVRDHGIGIAPDDMGRLFVRFNRLAVKELSDVPGTGLGLYLARELARLHGGEIMAISRKGVGSEFTLSLPLHQGPA